MSRHPSFLLRIAAAMLVLGSFALTAAGPAAAPKPAAKPAATAAKPGAIERGKQIALVSGCNDCHTPGAMYGSPDFARALSGSELGWTGPWGTTYARNLTPDPETGLGYYSAKEIVAALRGGKRLDGAPILPPMPWQNLSGYSDADLDALAQYLLSLPPIEHKVPDRVPPGTAPSGAALTFPAPPAWDAPRSAK
jgi:mono/diheme cytochrome c family protein